jgi:cell wall-associated NlpC family hydrolase
VASLIMIGCRPHPRYRTGPTEREIRQPVGTTGYTTNDYLRLGKIMRSYLGKPYAGRSRYEKGIDCSMFIKEVFNKFDGRALPRTVAGQYQQGKNIRRARLQLGDLVFFKTDQKPVSHIGIFLDNNRFMHASKSNGVIISSLKEQYYAKRYVSSRRILQKASSGRSR